MSWQKVIAEQPLSLVWFIACLAEIRFQLLVNLEWDWDSLRNWVLNIYVGRTVLTWAMRFDCWTKLLSHSVHLKSFSFLWTFSWILTSCGLAKVFSQNRQRKAFSKWMAWWVWRLFTDLKFLLQVWQLKLFSVVLWTVIWWLLRCFSVRNLKYVY